MGGSGDENASESDKPVQFPFPEPSDVDFEDDIGEKEKEHYKKVVQDINLVKTFKLHCTACDRHLGCSTRNDSKMRVHPMLRTLVCSTCHTFYNSGEFDKGEDGSELYCRWCGQGGQVYCCSDCPVVFCAKCIKRNFGIAKIKEIENTDDWKCFKCNPIPLWDLRAICWALLRYVDLKIKITHKCSDTAQKDLFIRDGAIDHSTCCKDKKKRVSAGPKKKEEPKKVEPKIEPIVKLPPAIQVKKFASMNETPKKSAQKRPASPKFKQNFVTRPISIAPFVRPPMNVMMGNPLQPLPKRPKLTPNPMYNIDRKQYGQYMARKPHPQFAPSLMARPQLMNYNGYPTMTSDNINLSLENLTQGLDMAMLANNPRNAMADDSQLVCTPDFPLEPVCEVTEENNDDDVECITPGPIAPPKPTLVNSGGRRLNKVNLDTNNIIQMTENDVTVNALTGGLKFRVDPQTLSSNKMYRLPDGRVFAINSNPKMPGGYSATIVALADEKKQPPKGTTYSAKVSTITKPPPLLMMANNKRNVTPNKQINSAKEKQALNINPSNSQSKNRKCDLNVPIEWYIYNITDAIDSLEYTLGRLKKVKKNANSVYLRSRTTDEVRLLHKNLDRLLSNSATRFSDIRVSLSKGFKSYCQRKEHSNVEMFSNSESEDEDDDDVEILADNHDDPIFIDENSIDSSTRSVADEAQVDLINSDLNDSGEASKSAEKGSKDKTSKPNAANNDTEEPVSTTDIDNIETENAEDRQKEKEKDKLDAEGSDSENVTGTSRQNESVERMEVNDESEGEAPKSDAKIDSDAPQNDEPADNCNISEDKVDSSIQNDDEASDKNNESNDKMETNVDSTKDEGTSNLENGNGEQEDEKDNEDKVDKEAENSGDIANDKDNGVSSDDEIVEKEDIEGDVTNDSPDNIDDADIESLLKGGDELDDLASKVQCIVDMDPDLI